MKQREMFSLDLHYPLSHGLGEFSGCIMSCMPVGLAACSNEMNRILRHTK